MTARTRRSATLLWTLFFVFSIGLQYVAALTPQTTLADVAPSVFELDGNAVTNHAGAGLPDDWDRVFNHTSSATHTVFLNDAWNSGTDDIFKTGGQFGSTDPADLSSWQWTNQKPQGKDDIENAYAASYVNAANGHRLAFFGLDRYDTSGDAFVGFWFLKGPVAKASNGTFVDNLGNPAVHHEGDVLIQANFTIGGTISTFLVSKWHNGALQQVVSNNVDCSNNPGGGDEACGIVNAINNIASPWSYTPKSGNANQFPTSAFFEGGLDMTTAGLDQGCFSSFMAETRSSQSLSSTLSDFALGTFSFCSPPTITTNAQLNGQNLSTANSIGSISLGQSVTDHATFSGSNGTVTGSVQFSVCGPNASAPDCSSGGTAVGSPVTITGGSPSTANSPPFTPTAAGYYCFRADYTPDTASSNKYLAASETNTNTECFRVLAPNLSITKTADAPSVSAGDPIGFTITVSNNSAAGTGTASNVTLSDPLPTGSGITWSIAGGTGASDCTITSGTLSCSFGDMAPGASFTVHVTSPTNKTSCATYPNTATAQATNNAAVQASASTTVNCASVAIVKTPDQGTVSAGDQIGFTVTVTNNGLGTASGVTVDDPLPTTAGTSWAIDTANSSPGWSINNSGHLVYGPATLASKASVHVHITSGTTAASCGVVSNTASVATSNDGSGSSTATVTVNCPKLSIVKTADAPTVSAGDPIGFTVTVSNASTAGTGTAHAVTLSDPLPAGVTWTISPAYSGPGTCSITSGTLNCAFGDMAPGASASVHVTALTSAAACSLYNNTATASATNAPSIQASASIQCLTAALTINKVADSTTVSAGDPIGFTIQVGNAGPGIARSVTLSDPLPAGVTWTISPAYSGPGTCSITGGVLSCSFGDMAAHDSASVHIAATTSAAACSVYNNLATASATNTGSVQAPASITCLSPDLSITKVADATIVNAGDPIGFTVTVANSDALGTGIARSVTLSDPLPAGVTWTISPAYSGPGTCSITGGGVLSCSFGDMAPGASASVHVSATTSAAACSVYNNTATASATNAPSIQASASVTCRAPDVTIVKTADAGPFSAGDTIGFTVTVSNIGAGTANDVTATDTLPTTPGTSWSITTPVAGWSIAGGVLTFGGPATSLAPGASSSVHIQSATTSASCGTVSNTGLVSATNEPASNTGNNSSTASLQVNCGDVTVTKTADATPVQAGDQIGFTITVSNIGLGIARNVTVTDPLPTTAGLSWSISGPANGFSISGGNLTWGPTDLAPGASVSVHIVSSTTRASCTTIPNTVNVTTTNDGNPTANASVTVLCPFMSITKANNTDGPVQPGASVEYTLTLHVTNPPVPSATIVDQLPTGIGSASSISDGGTYNSTTNQITWNLTNVADGKTLTYTAVVSASAAAGSYTNVATITNGPCVEGGCSSTSTVVVQTMSITKANDTTGPVAPGTAVHYTLTLHVTNGPVPTATVVDQLPDGIGNATNISDAGTYDSAANTITWHLSDVSDGDTLTYTAVVSTTAATGSYVNTATITSGPCQGSGCSATSTVVVPALTLTKSVVDNTANNGTTTINGVAVPLVKVGDALTYTLTYALTNGPVHNAVITDVMPTGVDYVAGSASNGGTYDAGSRTLTWSLGTLTAGGTVTYQATVPTGADKLTQPLTNVATIQSTETAPVSAQAAVYVVFEQVFPATGTPPATSTVPASSNGTGGLNLAVVVLGLAMLMTVIGLLTPMPERARRRSSRR